MSHLNRTLEIDLHKLLKLLPLAFVVRGVLEVAVAVKIVVKAFYSAEAACEAFKVCRKIRTFFHKRIMAQAGYIILGTDQNRSYCQDDYSFGPKNFKLRFKYFTAICLVTSFFTFSL